MVMYVQRVDFIVDLFDTYGIEQAEIIVGDSVVTKIVQAQSLRFSFDWHNSSTRAGYLCVFRKISERFTRNGFLPKQKTNSRTFSAQPI